MHRGLLAAFSVTALIVLFQNCSKTGFPDVRGLNGSGSSSSAASGGRTGQQNVESGAILYVLDAGGDVANLETSPFFQIDGNGFVRLTTPQDAISYDIVNLGETSAALFKNAVTEFAALSQPTMVSSASCTDVAQAPAMRIKLKASATAPAITFYEDVSCAERKWNLDQNQAEYDSLLKLLKLIANPAVAKLIVQYRADHPMTTPENPFDGTHEILRLTTSSTFGQSKLSIFGDGRVVSLGFGADAQEVVVATLQPTFLRRLAYYVNAVTAHDLEEVIPAPADPPAVVSDIEIKILPASKNITLFHRKSDSSEWRGGEAQEDQRATLISLLQSLAQN